MSARSTDRRRLAERLVSCLPAASFELETLCRLAGIVESRAIATAAVSAAATRASSSTPTSSPSTARSTSTCSCS